MLPPLFVKAHVKVKILDQQLEFIHAPISTFGVSSLPWGQLDPSLHFGKRAQVQIRIPQLPDESLDCEGTLLREATVRGQSMIIKFDLTPDARVRLKTLIQRIGFYPSEHFRKYPRIPLDEALQTFPTRVLLSQRGEEPIVGDVQNLSPNGVLVLTENPNVQSWTPGVSLDLDFEPRGWFRTRVRATAILCRTTDELHPKTRAFKRYLGLKFTHLTAENRVLFHDRLKDILLQLKSQSR